MNKKERTKNRTLRDTKWERGRSRIKVVYINYRTPIGEVRGNPFKTKNENSERSFKFLY